MIEIFLCASAYLFRSFETFQGRLCESDGHLKGDIDRRIVSNVIQTVLSIKTVRGSTYNTIGFDGHMIYRYHMIHKVLIGRYLKSSYSLKCLQDQFLASSRVFPPATSTHLFSFSLILLILFLLDSPTSFLSFFFQEGLFHLPSATR